MAGRTFYGRRPNEADIPEASQQTGMFTNQSPIPDADEKIPPQVQETPDTVDYSNVGGEGIVVDASPAPSTKGQRVIGEDEIHEAQTILQKYKAGKANLEARVQKDELFWELRTWEAIGVKASKDKKEQNSQKVKSTSAWLFNSIINKHADAMDNFPEPLVLPREISDEDSAKMLKSVLPVVLEYNKFKKTYRNNWWDKLVHGTGIYGIFWDSTKENGLGDISIKQIDIMKIFWEPGITDIQESRNIFICELVDADLLKQMYPDHAERISPNSGGLNVSEYLYDESIDTTDKVCVVDWYYKVHDKSGRTILHFVKFVDDEVLYATENDPELAERGMYDHGMYPVVFDVMFPFKGTPAGFGFVTVQRDPQIFIDSLSSNILQSSMMGTKKRYFASGNSGIDVKKFLNWEEPIVPVNGQIDPSRLQEIKVDPISPTYLNILQMKIEEMKETSSNRDVSNGSSGAGITSGAAISALQEAGNKTSRDMISNTYEAFEDICKICIELMRQFYDEARAFRVVGANDGQYDFIDMDNSKIGDQPILAPNGLPMVGADGQPFFRRPVFDVKVQAQKRNPFSTMEANQRAAELYGMGFFNPERAQEALPALEMMEFEGKDKVIESVQQGQTLLNIVQQMQQVLDQQAMMIQALSGSPAPMGGAPAPQEGQAPQQAPQQKVPQMRATNAAGVQRTPYQQQLAQRSSANMDIQPNAARPS